MSHAATPGVIIGCVFCPFFYSLCCCTQPAKKCAINDATINFPFLFLEKMGRKESGFLWRPTLHFKPKFFYNSTSWVQLTHLCNRGGRGEPRNRNFFIAEVDAAPKLQNALSLKARCIRRNILRHARDKGIIGVLLPRQNPDQRFIFCLGAIPPKSSRIPRGPTCPKNRPTSSLPS